MPNRPWCSTCAERSAGALRANATRSASRFTAPSSSASGSSAFTTATPPGAIWRKRRAIAVRRMAMSSRRTAGEEPRSVTTAASKVTPSTRRRVECVGVEFEDGPGAAVVDHRGEHGGQALGAGHRGSGGIGADAVGPAEPADQAMSAAGGFEDRAEEDGGQRRAGGSRHADGEQVLGGIARQCLAEPRQRARGVGDDDLEPARFGDGPLDHDPRRAPLERLGHEGVAVVPRCRGPRRRPGRDRADGCPPCSPRPQNPRSPRTSPRGADVAG